MGDISSYPMGSGSTANSVLGYAQVTTNQAGITSVVDLNGLAITVSVPAGRTLRITGEIEVQSTVVNDVARLAIQEGATTFQVADLTLPLANITGKIVTNAVIVSPSAGLHTYKLTLFRIVGTGSLTMNAANPPVGSILIEDITGGTGGSGPLQLAYAEVTADQGTFTAATDLIGLAATVSVPAGRRIKITGSALFQSSVANDRVDFVIQEGATTLQVGDQSLGNVNSPESIEKSIIITPTAGTHTYKLTANRSSGTGVITMRAGATFPAFILVEDITGTPSPAGIMPTSQTLAYSEVTTTQSGISTVADLTGLAATISVPSARRIKITGKIAANGTVASSTAALSIKEGATILQNVQIQNSTTAGNGTTLEGEVIITPSAGTHTYKLTLELSAGTGTVGMAAGATFPAFILIEDVTGGSPAVNAVNVPVGQLAYAQVVANQGSITTETALTGLSVNIVVPAGRNLRVRGKVNAAITSGVGDQINLRIKQDGTTIQEAPNRETFANGALEIPIEAIVSPSAGAHTYNLTLGRDTGSATITMQAGASFPAFLLVEDISPTPEATTGAPSSTLAYAEILASQGSITTATDVTGLSVTVTVPAGRRIRISSEAGISSTVATDGVDYQICEGATVLQDRTAKLDVQAPEVVIHTEVIVSPSAGTHTYKIRASRFAGTGTATVTAASNKPAYILVEDITASTYTYTQPGVLPVSSTSLPSNPSVGAMVYEVDTGATRIWNGTSWQIFGSGGNVTLGYAQITANQTGITGEVDITGLSVTVTIPAGRRIRVSSYLQPFTTVAADTFLSRIYQDGVQVQQGLVGLPLTGTGYSLDTSVELTPSAGTHTYKMTGFRNNGSGSLSVFAAANTPSFILVEDITGNVQASSALTVPVGLLAQAQLTANQAAITTETDIIGLSLNVSVPSGRVIKLRVETYLQNSAINAAAGARMFIKEGSTYLQQSDLRLTATAVPEKFIAEAIISPTAGAHTYIVRVDNGGGGTVTLVAGAGFPTVFYAMDVTPTPATASGAPSSTLAYTENFANTQTFTNTYVDLTGGNVTVTVPAGRRIRISGKGHLSSSVANDRLILAIREGPTVLNDTYMINEVANIGQDMYVTAITTPTAATHTYTLSAIRNSGTGTGSVYSNPGDSITYILVEDITGISMPRDTSISTINYILNTTAAGGGGNTTSTTYVDYPTAIDKVFTKGLSTTSLIVQGSVGAFRTVGAGVVFWALLINGVDYPIAQFFYNDLSTHRAVPFHVPIATGLAAGTYTARLRWRVDANTANVDGNDVVHISITEGVTG